ncbi:anhydro-N-acetylmuramic acid kinase AnmK [Clostridium septicum]|uniref:anhydro-N-acetylmuramic acid kinase AnmK n=1 Tax=Clostridium septicum TaxID=1504 RepID=UPI000836442F|nr:anhydro-N-acetylmuramic acid kinase AnmK [Clostridium septicum]MDU1313557.1 anhydro-N-acetylmuramic acid kinase AnmK [Clostridium septicum]WLF69177.1 anhydro-N-acetylmuramic acid kinase AnmK [Clostridium septicum]
MYSVGLMSGTSLDGVDAALVEIIDYGIDTKIKLMEFITLDIPRDIKEEIKLSCHEEKSSVDLICSLNFKLGYLFSNAVKEVCKKAKFSLENLDFIATHGQTIYHIPKKRGSLIPSTMQIGEPAIIAYETGVKVISNFRVMDMAAGGEGAPLVPFSEFVLYGSREESIALQNIGGIGNVTVIPNTGNINDVFAFDTGPGNMIIDDVCQRLFGASYDEDGKFASKGMVNNTMLIDLMNHPYILSKPPKSTGREEFGQKYVDEILEKYKMLKSEDILATVTMFTAKSISENYKKFILSKVNLKKIVIGGGGAHNKTLLKYIKEELPNIKIVTQDELGFSSDAKEAIAFVILGNETLNESFSNVPSATGATNKVILGNITPSPIRR